MEGEEGVEGWEAVDNEPTGRWGREGRKENEDRFLTPSFFPLVPSNTKKKGERGGWGRKFWQAIAATLARAWPVQTRSSWDIRTVEGGRGNAHTLDVVVSRREESAAARTTLHASGRFAARLRFPSRTKSKEAFSF